MKDELVDSTYLRLKACATSVEQYFTWDIREDILEKDDISYQFIDSLQDEHIEQTLFMEDERSQLFSVPCNEGLWTGCPYRWQVQLKPEGLHGDHEVVHDKGRGSV